MTVPTFGFDIINYTPHAIHLGELVFESSGNIRLKNAPARKIATWKDIVPICDAPTYEGLDTLPDDVAARKNARAILVSLPVGEYVRAHPDALPGYLTVLGPDTSPAHVVRNDKGQIVGSNALVMYRGFV